MLYLYQPKTMNVLNKVNTGNSKTIKTANGHQSGYHKYVHATRHYLQWRAAKSRQQCHNTFNRHLHTCRYCCTWTTGIRAHTYILSIIQRPPNVYDTLCLPSSPPQERNLPLNNTTVTTPDILIALQNLDFTMLTI